MRRVVVLGTSCSGKTTLAGRVAAVLGVPHVELDAIHWGPNWSSMPAQEFRDEIQAILKDGQWVVDGNYRSVRDIVWPQATDAIWLNYSFPVVFWRALARTVRRIVLREELFSGNRETFKDQFMSRGSLLWWVITTYRPLRREYRRIFDSEAFPGLRVTELRRPRQSEPFLRDLAAGRAPTPDANSGRREGTGV